MRHEAIQRRGRATQGALSALKHDDANTYIQAGVRYRKLNGRIVSSARTLERDVKTITQTPAERSPSRQPALMGISTNVPSQQISRAQDPSKEDISMNNK